MLAGISAAKLFDQYGQTRSDFAMEFDCRYAWLGLPCASAEVDLAHLPPSSLSSVCVVIPLYCLPTCMSVFVTACSLLTTYPPSTQLSGSVQAVPCLQCANQDDTQKRDA